MLTPALSRSQNVWGARPPYPPNGQAPQAYPGAPPAPQVRFSCGLDLPDVRTRGRSRASDTLCLQWGGNTNYYNTPPIQNLSLGGPPRE